MKPSRIFGGMIRDKARLRAERNRAEFLEVFADVMDAVREHSATKSFDVYCDDRAFRYHLTKSAWKVKYTDTKNKSGSPRQFRKWLTDNNHKLVDPNGLVDGT